ncbi:MFS transporter [Priestia endophytica]|uniref:MFS transporter n=1 Tax=Priestia endophytica TaxID=135735 RepID=UPI000DCA9512|nr:MFS transporter [Priestia endophytica]RAS87082.1 MFS transporter [Priestia endophytica]
MKEKRIVFIMCIGMFLCMLDSTIMNITLPAIQNDLGTTLEQSSWMLNIYTMTIAVLAIPLTRYATMVGKNKVYIGGLLLFGLGSLLCGLSSSGTFLIFSRFVQSLGAAALIPLSLVISISALPNTKRAFALTLLGATQGLSTALGPSIGGAITELLSWHWVFYINIPLCLIGVLACLRFLNMKNEEKVKAKMDGGGLLFSTVFLFSVTFVLIKGNEWGWNSGYAWICYILSFLSFIFFIFIEKRAKSPMIDFSLFKDRLFLGSIFTASTGYLFLIGVMVLLPQFLTRFQGKSELEAAFLVTPVSAAIFLFSQFAALMVKKIGFIIPVVIGFCMMGGAYYLLSKLTVESTSQQIVTLCILLGVGFSFLIATSTIASTSNFEGELLASSQSVFSMLRSVGTVLAVAIFVGSLTAQMNTEKQEVVNYAQGVLEKSHFIQNKEELLKLTGNIIDENNEMTQEELIKSSIPSKLVNQNEEESVQEALAVKKELQNYVADVSKEAKYKMGESFGNLYRTAFPFLFLCAFLGLSLRFPFIKRRIR